MTLPRFRHFGISALALVGSACGDNELPCHGLGAPHYCLVPLKLALRTTHSLTPSTDEVRSYYRLLRPAYEKLPLLALTDVDINYYYPPSVFGLASAYPPLVSAWAAGERESADPLVAAILEDAPPSLTITKLDDVTTPPGYSYFWLETHDFQYLSWRVMLERLAALPSTIPGGMETPAYGMDVVHAVVGTDNVLTFDLGWGDCVNGCINRHRWVATVHTDDTVEIEDLGGAAPEVWQYEQAEALPPLPEL